MLIRVGLEAVGPSRSLAWGLDFPGCFAYGSDDAEAMLRFAGSLINFEHWIALHTDEPWFRLANADFRIVEAFQAKALPRPGKAETSTAFFEDDLRPLSRPEIDKALLVFRWQREELLAGLEFLPVGLPGRVIPEQQNTLETLKSIARTEHAYLGYLVPGLPPCPDAVEPNEALQFSQDLIEKFLPGLAEKNLVIENNAEGWSCRKLVRKLLWQQRVRIDGIKAQIGLAGA